MHDGISKKNYNDALPERQKKLTIDKSIRLDTVLYQHWTDRQADRQTELVKQYRALHALYADVLLKTNITRKSATGSIGSMPDCSARSWDRIALWAVVFIAQPL